jgi:hypothetical protein
MMSTTNGEQPSGGSSVRQESFSEQMADKVSKPRKLHGRAFYESLGSPRFFLSPMKEAFTDYLDHRHGGSSRVPS